MDDFERELKVGFLEEASQLLSDAEQCFLVLESSPGDASTLDRIFRIAHNLKGSSKAVGFDDIGVFTHLWESFLLKLKNGETSVNSEVINLLLLCNDHVRVMVEALKQDLEARVDSTELLSRLNAMISGESIAMSFSPGPVSEATSASAFEEEVHGVFEGEPPPSKEELELLKLVNDSLDDLPNPALEVTKEEENLVIPDPGPIDAEVRSLPAPVFELKRAESPKASGSASTQDESIRVSLSRLEKLINSVGELVILQTVLREQSMSGGSHLLRKTIHQMGKVTKEVQDISMSLRMVPLRQTFQKMQRIVRDTSNMLDKRVSLSTQGDDTELDKTVLENISDPLVHLIRNACDHGIERPEDRIRAGKSETGNVMLNAYHQSGKLVIEVKDDGGGIDGDRLIKKAIEKGILKPDSKLSPQEAIHLIFHPGFSTKAQVTEVSGRGVGMDVVKTNIEALQGEVLVETELGKGTTFKVILPLTLAIIDGMVVKNGKFRFVVPLSHVHETLRPTGSDIQSSTGMGEMLLLRGENLPLFRLSRLLGQKRSEEQTKEQIAMVIRYSSQPFAVMVDDILGQQQVVIKEVGPEIRALRWMSGSAILGDGKPAIILEMNELVKPEGRGVA
ncbi:MAG: chemotaxis protein CheA [Bdellovibrionales bacterium]|nr:chemotaxis protein CheA [Bdellovibrionales bacterium]